MKKPRDNARLISMYRAMEIGWGHASSKPATPDEIEMFGKVEASAKIEEADGGIVLRDIHSFIALAFLFGINPLRGLRQAFPVYIWQFHEGRTVNFLKGDRATFINCFDFVLDFGDSCVTAVNPSRAKHLHTYCNGSAVSYGTLG